MHQTLGTVFLHFLEKEGPAGFCRMSNTPCSPVGGRRIHSLRAFSRASVHLVGVPKGRQADRAQGLSSLIGWIALAWRQITGRVERRKGTWSSPKEFVFALTPIDLH